MSIHIITISSTEYIVDNTHVTVWRDGENAVRTNPVLHPDKLRSLKEHIESIYAKRTKHID